MNSLYWIVQVVLIAMMVILVSHHLQLKRKYEDLKISCENSYLQIQNRDVETLPVRSKPLSKKDISISGNSRFLMHSSLKEDCESNEDVSIVNDDYFYIDEYEPTLQNSNAGRNDMTLIFSSQSFEKEVDETVLQTSNVDSDQTKTEMLATQVKMSDILNSEVMSSTGYHNTPINLSESLPVQLTGKKDQIHESTSHIERQHLTNQSTDNLDLSVIDETVSVKVPKIEKENVEMFDKFKSMNENINKFTAEDESKSDGHQDRLVELHSSQWTMEEEIYACETGLVEKINEDLEYFPHFDSEDSPTVLNTIDHSNHHYVDHTADNTDYEDSDENDEYEDDDDDEWTDAKEHGFGEMDHNQNEVFTLTDKSVNTPVMKAGERDENQLKTQGTSVFCDGEPKMRCRFQNLCYNTKEKDFVFFKGDNSKVETAHKKIDNDIFDINLCTVEGHNTAIFSMVSLPTKLVDQFKIGIVPIPAVTISRFKPDNIMHVLHDDILPLFDTLIHHKFTSQNNVHEVAIIFTDAYEVGDYIDFYSSLSTVAAFHPSKYNQTYDLICFPDIQVGLQNSTVWYQYGFFKPQGPVSYNQANIMETIHKATDYLSSKFYSACFLCKNGNYLVFLSRKDNRLVLNEGELIMSLIKATKLKIMSVSLETHSLSQIITIIHQSRGVLGMHGSLLSLSLFLPIGSFIVELFPFAINPSKYTPFKTLADLPGSGLVYRSWTNLLKEKSFPHPNRCASEGGIQHLPKDVQENILGQTEVPDHLCCEDPSWLYHIYQDTHVDVPAVTSLVTEAISEAEKLKESSVNSNSIKLSSLDVPGSVKNLRCYYENAGEHDEQKLKDNSLLFTYHISWETPWVFNYDSDSSGCEYEIVIQQANNDEVSTFILPSSQLSYKINSWKPNSEADYNIWVRVVTKFGVKSTSKFIRCSK